LSRDSCLKLFVLPPRSPKLNGHAERAQKPHTEEFYEVTDTSFEISELNRALRVNSTVILTLKFKRKSEAIKIEYVPMEQTLNKLLLWLGCTNKARRYRND